MTTTTGSLVRGTAAGAARGRWLMLIVLLAADASGLLTTTIQLGQAVGVATFGSLFLTLEARRAGAVAVVSGHALAVTFGWLAVLMTAGAAAGIPLARTVAGARSTAEARTMAEARRR